MYPERGKVRISVEEWADLVASKIMPDSIGHDEIAAMVQKRISKTWSESSWGARRLVAERAAEELQISLEEVLECPEKMLVASVRVAETRVSDPDVRFKYNSAQTYLRNAKALAISLGVQQKALTFVSVYHKALNPKELDTLDESAASPSLELVRSLLKKAPAPLQTVLYLMFKAASRWDEVGRLTRSQILIMEEREMLLVQWRNTTKGSREDPHHPRFLTILSWSGGSSTKPSKEVMEFLAMMKPSQKMSDFVPQSQVQSYLGAIKTEEEEKDYLEALGVPVRDHLSLHSMKKAGLRQVGLAVAEGKVDASLLALLAKHKDQVPTILPSITARYLTDKVNLGLIHGTQKATELI